MKEAVSMNSQAMTCSKCNRILSLQDRIEIDHGTFTALHHPTYVYTCPHCGHIEASHDDFEENEHSISS